MTRLTSANLPGRDVLVRFAAMAAVTTLALWLFGIALPIAVLAGVGLAAVDGGVAYKRRGAEYTPTPGRLKLAAWAVLLVAVLPIVAFVQERHTAQGLHRDLTAATGTINGLRTNNPPAGFAAHCFELFTAVGGPGSAEQFTKTCNPGIDTTDLEKQRLNALQAVGTTPVLGPGLSYADPTRPNYYSVLLATHLRSWQAATKKKPGAWKDLGPAYFRVAVVADATGAPALRGLPRQVAAPVAAEVPNLSGTLSQAVLDDSRVAVLHEFLQRYLIEPPEDRPHDGDVGQYVAPSVRNPVAVHSSVIEKVDVLKASFVLREGTNLTDALAVAEVTYRGGAVSVQSFPFVLVQSGTDQWQVASMPGTPPLQP